MNKITTLLALLLMLTTTEINSASMVSVESTPLEISDIKWVYLQFSSDVKYADMGTEQIQVEISKVPSIIRIKSNEFNFHQTSITVITLDGRVHTYDLHYQKDPSNIAYQVTNNELHPIEPFHIELSHRQTSHIIFPSKVIDIQSGNDQVIFDHAEEIDNIIKCKSISAGFESFEETSITIISEEKVLYPFLVKYKEYPNLINIQMTDGQHKQEAIFSSLSINEPQLQNMGKKIIEKGCIIKNIGTMNHKMAFSLFGIYVKEEVMMFFLNIENPSKIDYEIDFIKCYIINKKTNRKQSYQANEKEPLFTYTQPERKTIPANEKQPIVFFFKKFTIPNKHKIHVELFEKNGGRHLKFAIPYKKLLQAKHLE